MNGAPARDAVVRHLAAALRAHALYSPGHPLVERNVIALLEACGPWLRDGLPLVIAFIGAEVVVDNVPVRHLATATAGLARTLALHNIGRIRFGPGLTADELRLALDILSRVLTAAARTAERTPTADTVPPDLAPGDRLARAGVRHVAVGEVRADAGERVTPGLASAIETYDQALHSAETFWEVARAGDQPNAADVRALVNRLAQAVADDRPSLMALTTLKRHDAYTFTHMVNVSILTMALARSLGIADPVVREFGLAALVHDIGKTRTPAAILNKRAALGPAEMATIRRHVVDGAELLWGLPDMPRLAAIVAFEHHLRVDASGYPENVRPRQLNLCTMIVSIADMYDALRTNRPYRDGLAADRVRQVLVQQNGGGFHPSLLKRFIVLVGLYPVGTLVRLETGEIGIVTCEHPDDPLRPQVKVVLDAAGKRFAEPYLLNTWERGEGERGAPGIAEPLGAEETGLDPVALLGAPDAPARTFHVTSGDLAADR